MSLTNAQANMRAQHANTYGSMGGQGGLNTSIYPSGIVSGSAVSSSLVSSNSAQQKLDLANTALKALISKTESYLLTNAELAEKAWLITDEMVKEAAKRGVYL